MKDSIKNRKKNLLALCLSVLMLSSTAAFAACSKGDSTDSSSSSSSSSAESTAEVKDDGLIKNAGFETFDDKNAINTSNIAGWTRSVNSTTSGNASSSKAASGVIDLSTEGWKMLTGNNENYDVSTMTVAQIEAAWDKLTVKDKLAFTEKWEADNEGKDIAKELDFYVAPNIDEEDIPTIEHFDTHDKAVENGGEDTKVLMIHNEYPGSATSTYQKRGTAQKYTSSSTVTVKAGTAAKFSVWVKTKDLQSSSTAGEPQEAVGKGAYISVTHSVGGTSLDEYKVENINTEQMQDSELSNGWKQYSFLLQGSSYTDTTFSLVLGLGQGGNTYIGEYVNGYAFFDDIECEIIESDTYTESITAWKTNHAFDENTVVDFTHEGEEKVVDVSKVNRAHFAMDFSYHFSDAEDTIWTDGKATTTKTGGTSYTAEKLSSYPVGTQLAPGLSKVGGLDGSTDVKKVFNSSTEIKDEVAIKDDALTSKLYDDYFTDKDKDGNIVADPIATGKTLLLLSKKGVPYTSEMTNAFTLASEKYMAISVFVKTSEMEGATGAGITLKSNTSEEVSFASIDTTTIDPVDIGEKKDIYNGWQQYFFFVKNTSDATATLTLSFQFGPTTINTESTVDAYGKGFAAFTALQVVADMEEEIFNSAQEGTYAKILTIGEEEEEGSVFDNAIGAPTNALKEGLANPQNYKGVYSNSAYVTGNGSMDINTSKNAGLLSKEEFVKEDGYYATYDGATAPAWLKKIYNTANDVDATNAWDKVFGSNSTQPLFLYNDGTVEHAYGFLGNSTSVAANTYTVVSVRVKGTAGASAYVRLVDTNGENYEGISPYNKPLSIGGKLTYWYDDDGNICTGDPAKTHRVAFKLQPNGLYKINKNYEELYKSETMSGRQDAYFANLQAYDKKDADGNLLVAESGASHNYTNYWNNEGMDGIAYYCKEGKYYADKACKIAVEDLASVVGLEHRYEATASKNLEANVELADNAWTTVTFYLHTGDIAKNYRLELWAGKLVEGTITPNAADSYVLFDYNNPGTAEDNFTKYLDSEDYTDAATDKFEGVFSYFDTANYLRYNESLDENNIGNLYKDNYTPSANEDGIAYLYSYKKVMNADDTAVQSQSYTFFADYQYSEKAVTAAEADTEEEEDKKEESDEPQTNIWLLVSSLAIAGVLLLAIVSIIVRKVILKNRKKRVAAGYVKPTKKDKKSKK